MTVAVQELKLSVPTFYPNDKEDWKEPNVPILVRESEGVRVVLGAHELDDYTKPDIQIERRRNGWCIFLHPVGGQDACGYVYFHDDGRSWFHHENDHVTEQTVILEHGDEAPKELDGDFYHVETKRRLLVQQLDSDEEDNERITPAGEIVEIREVLPDQDACYSVICEKTGGWWFFTREEIDTQTEPV